MKEIINKAKSNILLATGAYAVAFAVSKIFLKILELEYICNTYTNFLFL